MAKKAARVEVVKVVRFVASLPGRPYVEFVPVERVPGFSHKVITVNGGTSHVGWLPSDVTPTERVAREFFEKHRIIADK